MTNIISFKDISHTRNDQMSYHLASEEHSRIQIFNLSENEILGPWKCEGSIVITFIAGTVEATINNQTTLVTELNQALIMPKDEFSLKALSSVSSVQFIWIPAFAKVETDTN